MAYKIVIIDDEKEISSGFAQFFPWAKLGYQVVAQYSGAREALEYLLQNPVDVVVSDIRMPGMTGIDLARELFEAELAHKPRLLLFSAYEEFEYARKALQYKCTDYLLKSTDYEELVETFSHLKQKLDEEKGGADEEPGQDKIIATIKEYVKNHPAEACLEDAAKLVYMSSSYVSRYFKQKTGESFTDYVIKKKMKLAASLLLDLQYKIYDISEELGYKNPVNFTRSFKKLYGLSPKEYRFEKLGRVSPGDEELENEDAGEAESV